MSDSAASSSAFARSALRFLAEQRLEPSPRNYLRAWQIAGGPVDAADAELAARAASGGRPAGVALLGKLARADRTIRELRELLAAVCEAVAAQTGGDGWWQPQIAALRRVADSEGGSGAIAAARDLLVDSAQKQRSLSGERRRSTDLMRDTMREAIVQTGTIGATTVEFGREVAEFAGKVQASESLASIGDLASSMATRARTVGDTVTRAGQDLDDARQRVEDIETMVRRMESELSATTQALAKVFHARVSDCAQAEHMYGHSLARRKRDGEKVALVIAEIDGWNALASAMDRATCDAVIGEVMTVLRGKLRQDDSAKWLDDEQFMLLLHGIDSGTAQSIMTRVQRELTRVVFLNESRQLFMTFSSGVTDVGPEDSLTTARARAEAAMYEARDAGRNCVAIG